MNLYIRSAECICAQPTFGNKLPNELRENNDDFYSCIQPDYKKYISSNILRRMSPIIRNGVTCSLSALTQAEINIPDAIIIGTALGCIKDTTSFLSQLINDKEELPNPTSFIQSTHNTIAGQLAVLLSCKSYNFTFSQMHNSFECALLDATLLLKEMKGKNVLVGGVDELIPVVFNMIKNYDCYSNSKLGEGAGFFVLSTEKSAVCLDGVKIINNCEVDFDKELNHFSLSKNDIDMVIGGNTSDADNSYNSFSNYFENIPYVWYKPFVGEFGTVSSIALWIGVKAIEEQSVPLCWFRNGIMPTSIRRILIYNKKGTEQSIMLISRKKL
ncbi:MAG: beta-ketoacyl synthase chain length factor [Marinilabiliaceae bacterium]|nr:beta-ketoacyl synthase chain length factor [Marinilabiliaceae bacterium]